jgi:hypothetical protein
MLLQLLVVMEQMVARDIPANRAFFFAEASHLLLLLPAVCGSKWSKRALGMTAPAEQLQFAWHAARYIALCSKRGTSAAAESAADDVVAAAGDMPAGSTAAAATASAEAHRSAGSISTAAAAAAAELNKLQELRDSIVAQLPAEHRGHFSITLDDVQAAAAAAAAGGDGNEAAAGAAGPSVSAISFESVGDALEVSAAK